MSSSQRPIRFRPAPSFALLPSSSAGAPTPAEVSRRRALQLRAGAEVEEPSARLAFRVSSLLSLPEVTLFDWRHWADIILFVSLIAVGLRLVSLSKESMTTLGFLGPLLFNAGLTPFVLALWAATTGSSLFRRENVLKALFSGAVFGLGFALWQVSEMDDSSSILEKLLEIDVLTLVEIFGPAFLEIGVLFFVEKMFFLEEDDELRIERLEKELEQAKRGMGMGLAASYFYNFLLPTAANFTEDDASSEIEVEVARGKFAPGQLLYNKLVVLVPRTLEQGTDIKGVLRDFQSQGRCLQGRPKERERTHRPLFAFLLPKLDAEGSASLEAAQSIDFMFDLPTIVSSVRSRYDDAMAAARLAVDGDDVLSVDIEQEMLDFQNALIGFVRENPLTSKKVRLVSIADASLSLDDVRYICEQLASAEH